LISVEPQASFSRLPDFTLWSAHSTKPVEYDEALTVLIAGGNGKVDWPNGIIPAVTAQDLLSRSDGIDALRYYRHFTR
jgi:hypothetical protein